MKAIFIRNVPDDLHRRLRQLARSKNLSLNKQVVVMLANAIANEVNPDRQSEILASIQSRRFIPPKNAPSSLDLLHEGRR